jgi:hypothetical protein
MKIARRSWNAPKPQERISRAIGRSRLLGLIEMRRAEYAEERVARSF